jgi:hypothetical protein
MTQHQQMTPHEQREWRSRAACRTEPPELFFPTAESGPARAAQVAAAKAVCARCPVRQDCLVEALRRIPYGICGGLTEHERRRLRTTRTNSEPVGSTTSRSDEPRTRRDVGESAAVREVLVDGPGRWLSGRERTRVGRALLAAGCPPRQVARVCGVTERTVARWATRTSTATRTPPTTGTSPAGCGVGSGPGEGSAAATGLPSGSSQHPIEPSEGHEHRKGHQPR